jgi:predicted DNA-binding transcriptional regulator AlpA
MPAEPIVPIRPTTEDPAAVNFVEALGGRPRAKGPAAPAPAVEPLLVDTGQAAAICAIGRSTWFRLRSAGRTPAPVKLGGRVLYRLADLRLWVSLGCPPRREFEARRAAADASGRPR